MFSFSSSSPRFSAIPSSASSSSSSSSFPASPFLARLKLYSQNPRFRLISCIILVVIFVPFLFSPSPSFSPPVVSSPPVPVDFRPVALPSSVGRSKVPACSWRFHHYESSPWETEWLANIPQWKSTISSHLLEADQSQKSLALIARTWQLMNEFDSFNASAIDLVEADNLFSKLVYHYQCGEISSHLGVQWIEPLFGLLRDPLFLIQTKDGASMPRFDKNDEGGIIQSKRFLLITSKAPFLIEEKSSGRPLKPLQSNQIPPWFVGPRRILIDIGSTYFKDHLETESALASKWILRYMQGFDRIFAFEYKKLDPWRLWEDIPFELLSVYSPINHGVSADPSSNFHPWRFLQQVARPEDFVVVKLDIDTPDIENSLMDQLVAGDFGASTLIDEMFFEHHVNVPEMYQYWSTEKEKVDMEGSYKLFNKLREMGIRMHSWP